MAVTRPLSVLLLAATLLLGTLACEDDKHEAGVRSTPTVASATGTLVATFQATATPTQAAAPVTQDMPVIRIESATLDPNGSETVTLEIAGVTMPAIGAVTVDVSYDSKVAAPTACTENAGGGFDVAACNIAYEPTRIRITGISAGGATGSLALSEIVFQAIGERGQCSPLDVQVVQLADTDGGGIAVMDSDGTICVAPEP